MILDATDAKIIRILQENGRISMQRLSEMINMSSPAATERVKKLEDAGIIRGYAALVDPQKLGLAVHAFMHILTIGEHNRQRLLHYIDSTPEIVGTYYGMSGGLEVLLEIYCESNNRLAAIQNELAEMVKTVTYILNNQTGKRIPFAVPAVK